MIKVNLNLTWKVSIVAGLLIIVAFIAIFFKKPVATEQKELKEKTA
jgi:hypothetical protein